MRFSNLARMASLLPALCVAGCGDSGGGVNSASSNPGSSYTRFNNLSGAQTMAASGLMYNVRMINGAITLTVDASDPAIATANYNATTGAVSLTGPQGRASSFTASDIVSQTTAMTTYQKGVGSIPNLPAVPAESLSVRTPSVGGVDLSYTRIGVWSIWSTALGYAETSTGAFGVNTLASDMPRTGSASYTTAVEGSGGLNQSLIANGFSSSVTNYRVDAATSTASFTANFGANSLTTSLNLSAFMQTGGGANGPVYSPVPTPLATLTGSGTISSTGSTFSGTLASGSGASLNGQFSGGFFGPQAAEMAYFYGFSGQFPNGSTGFTLGAVSGRKP